MGYPIAEKFRSGALTKPIAKKEEFFVGGITAMTNRLKTVLAPYPRAFSEFESRTDSMSNASTVYTMWDYVKIE